MKDVFVYGTLTGFLGAYFLHSTGIVHHAVAPAPAKTVPVSLQLTPDTACGAVQALKPALTFSVNGVAFVAELDSGASAALMNPATATATKLTSLPKAGTINLNFAGQAPGTFQGYKASLSIPGLVPVPMTIYTGPQIGCNLIPTDVLQQQYVVGFGPKTITFTHV